MKEYRKGLKTKVMATCLFLTYTSIALYICWDIISRNNNQISIYSFLILLSMLLIPSILCYSIFRWKLRITDNSIQCTGLNLKQELTFDNIKGYTTSDSTITILSIDKNKEPILVNTSIEGTDHFKDWIAANFTNLGETIVLDREAEILQNDIYGSNEKERAKKLSDSKMASYTLYTIAITVIMPILLRVDPYNIAFILCAIYPIAAYIAYRKHKGLIKIVPMKRSPYTSIGLPIFFTAFAMAMSATDFQYINSKPLWFQGVIVAIIMPVIFIYYRPRQNANYNSQLFLGSLYLIVAGWIYGYGLCAFINSNLDNSSVETYDTIVINKYVVNGYKSTSNYICLSSWGPVESQSTVSVNVWLFNSLSQSDIAVIKYRKGALGVPWYTLEKR